METSIKKQLDSVDQQKEAPIGPSRTRQAQKALVRMMAADHLKPGDFLPGQQALRQRLNFSNDTLNKAMRRLEKQGLIRRQPRVGTLVLDPARVPAGVWSIGLALPPFEHPYASPYYAILAGYLQDRLARLGCHCRLYPHTRGTPGAEVYDPLRNFAHLGSDVAHGLVDGLITTYGIDGQICWELARKGLLVAQNNHASLGGPIHVTVDRAGMVRQAVQALHNQGCRQLALAQGATEYHSPWPNAGAVVQAFTQTAKTSATDSVYYAKTKGMWGGCEIAQNLLSLAPEDRPDGIIIEDDYLAMGLTSFLAPHSDYRPQFAVRTNRQSPLAFALPVIRFESDIELQATSLIEALITGLRDPDSLPQSISLNAATDEQMRQVPKENFPTNAT